MPNVTVTAVDTATAMDEIWDQLGPDAMIVSTKKQHGKIVMEATTETASTATEPPQASAAGFGTLFTNQMIGEALSEGWSIERLARIELAVLRCGAFELTAMPHLPVRAVVSEYAALSDACGCEVGFVNAVLDGLARGARSVEMQS